MPSKVENDEVHQGYHKQNDYIIYGTASKRYISFFYMYIDTHIHTNKTKQRDKKSHANISVDVMLSSLILYIMLYALQIKLKQALYKILFITNAMPVCLDRWRRRDELVGFFLTGRN